jgi:tetratricopeptide (TPR) repeat protein
MRTAPDAVIETEPALSSSKKRATEAFLTAALIASDREIAFKPDADAYLIRGDVLQALGRFNEALAAYGRAIQRSRPGGAARVHVMRAQLLYHLRRFKEAEADCASARFGPVSGYAGRNRGLRRRCRDVDVGQRGRG